MRNIDQRKELFTSRSLPEGTAVQCFRGVLGDVEIPAVQVSRIQNLKMEVKGVKRENELLASRFN